MSAAQKIALMKRNAIACEEARHPVCVCKCGEAAETLSAEQAAAVKMQGDLFGGVDGQQDWDRAL